MEFIVPRHFFYLVCFIVYKMRINASLFVLGAIIIFPGSLVVTYSISVYNKHVKPFWPYISHTGNFPIESCFFSLGLNIVSGIYAATTFFRFAQIRFVLVQEPNDRFYIINKSSVVWGLISSFGLSATSSFQQKNVKFVHLFGAVICSYCAFIYFWHQTYLSFYCTRWISRKIKYFRMTLGVCLTFIHVTGPFLYLYSILFHPLGDSAITEWYRDTETRFLYLTGSFMEWSVFICYELYVASFYWEFKDIYINLGELAIETNVRS